MTAELRNWQYRYRIRFGIPAYEEVDYYAEGSLVGSYLLSLVGIGAGVTTVTQDIPSDALWISNIPEDGDNYDIRGFDFSLDTKREMSPQAQGNEVNVLQIKNISPKMYDLFNTKGCVVYIDAGYKDTGVNLVYSGFVERVDVMNAGNDVLYKMTMKDVGIDVKNTKVSVDFDEATDVVTALNSLAKMFPSVTSTNIVLESLNGVVVDGGFSFEGKLIDNMEKVCKTYEIDYSFLNGRFVARPTKLFQGDASYNKISPNTFVFEAENIKSVDFVNNNAQKELNQKDTKRDVVLTTFLTPVTFDNFFTIPESVDEKFAGTYKVKTIGVRLNSRGTTAVWDTTLVGSPM